MFVWMSAAASQVMLQRTLTLRQGCRKKYKGLFHGDARSLRIRLAVRILHSSENSGFCAADFDRWLQHVVEERAACVNIAADKTCIARLLSQACMLLMCAQCMFSLHPCVFYLPAQNAFC